jgi:hypothetical protein
MHIIIIHNKSLKATKLIFWCINYHVQITNIMYYKEGRVEGRAVDIEAEAKPDVGSRKLV